MAGVHAVLSAGRKWSRIKAVIQIDRSSRLNGRFRYTAGLSFDLPTVVKVSLIS